VLPDPVVVRPNPNPRESKYQIIDGYHRWDIVRALGYEEIDVWVIDVETKDAMILTDTLNYLRGDPDPEKKAHYLQRLLRDYQMTPETASEFLLDTSDEIQEYLDNYEIKVDHIEIPDEVEGDPDSNDHRFVEIHFNVSVDQAEVIERELARVGGLITGKNVRGRALEFMAVNSSHTPVDNLMGSLAQDDLEDGDQKQTSLSKLKERLREKAQ